MTHHIWPSKPQNTTTFCNSKVILSTYTNYWKGGLEESRQLKPDNRLNIEEWQVSKIKLHPSPLHRGWDRDLYMNRVFGSWHVSTHIIIPTPKTKDILTSQRLILIPRYHSTTRDRTSSESFLQQLREKEPHPTPSILI